MDKPRANLCFQLVSRCYEQNSLVVTSNKAFNQWGEVFGDEVIAGAILNRLLHHSHIIAVQGESFRMRDKRPNGGDRASKPPDNQQSENSQEGGQFSMAKDSRSSVRTAGQVPVAVAASGLPRPGAGRRQCFRFRTRPSAVGKPERQPVAGFSWIIAKVTPDGSLNRQIRSPPPTSTGSITTEPPHSSTSFRLASMSLTLM